MKQIATEIKGKASSQIEMSDFYKERDPSGLGGDGIETDSMLS